MPALSTTARTAAFAPESGEVWLVLLTLEHASIDPPIRVVNNLENITSRGDAFIGFPFDLTLPDEKEDAPPRARLSIDNVSREIGQAIRQIVGPPSVLIEVVLASNPDQVEVSYPRFLLRNISYDAATVSGELMVQNLTIEPFPARRFTPGAFPGAF
jgi:hypothetical protein